MSDPAVPGHYDLLSSQKLDEWLQHLESADCVDWSEDHDLKELLHRLAIEFGRELSEQIERELQGVSPENWCKTIHDWLSTKEATDLLTSKSPVAPKSLIEISDNTFVETTGSSRPDTPLSISALLSGSSRSPALRGQLKKELATCDRADWIVSFVKWSGILPLLGDLETFTTRPAADGGPRLRLITTSYLGATDKKAVEFLVNLPNTEVKVSYDTKRTRMHAKAYVFHRETGFGSAYIGSANISRVAHDEGLEWTAKISQYELPYLWREVTATFESHWLDDEHLPCKKEDLPRLAKALAAETSKKTSDDEIPMVDLRPYQYQQIILDEIQAERDLGQHKHLVISATGTGKTMVAAFDYKRFCEQSSGKKNLLFIVHREEILKQARQKFRAVLRDGSFGEIQVGTFTPTDYRHVFCSVQSWNSRNYDRFPPDHFDYVVLDEAHHGTATSYQNLLNHIKPRSLLGLTATPERADGGDITADFGSFTHELRLVDAIERRLLCPFHYYGIPDSEDIDFSQINWRSGGYDRSQLDDLLGENKSRAWWVLSQADKYLTSLQNTRGLAFCASVRHAEFMAEYFSKSGVPSICLSASSIQSDRKSAVARLKDGEIKFIFTVDLYNEGVDLPFVDTVLFLRPTESLTVFLQQLGRGLRLSEGKSHLTVLDFIAPQARQFRFARRFRALSSRFDARIDHQILDDMPFVPTGCLINLERQAKKTILANISDATKQLNVRRLRQELQDLKVQTGSNPSLDQILHHLMLDSPDDVYKCGIPSYLLDPKQYSDEEQKLFNKTFRDGLRRLLLVDDRKLLQKWVSLVKTRTYEESLCMLLHANLWGKKEQTLEALHELLCSKEGFRQDMLELLQWRINQTLTLSPDHWPSIKIPLQIHCTYSKEQILYAFGHGTLDNPKQFREGVLWLADQKVDLFFADIHKSEAEFSPTTMYEDYAVSDTLFHWQSQSRTTVASPTGQRYIKHKKMGTTPLLFIRDRKMTAAGVRAPFFFAGPLTYVRHQGERPMSITWNLGHPLPARVMRWASGV